MFWNLLNLSLLCLLAIYFSIRILFYTLIHTYIYMCVCVYACMYICIRHAKFLKAFLKPIKYFPFSVLLNILDKHFSHQSLATWFIKRLYVFLYYDYFFFYMLIVSFTFLWHSNSIIWTSHKKCGRNVFYFFIIFEYVKFIENRFFLTEPYKYLLNVTMLNF